MTTNPEKAGQRRWIRLLPDLVFAGGFAVILLLLIRRLPYGWSATGDEPFYLAIPLRFLQGDAPVTQEWNMSQTSAVLLMPFVALWQAVAGSTEGIILFMRWVYLALHASVTLFAWWKLRKKNAWGAAAAALTHWVFVPYHVMALSYNTMALELLLAAGLLCADAKPDKKAVWLISGALFACAVLCCPILVLVYAVYGLLVLISHLVKKETGLWSLPVLRGRSFLLFTLSCAVLAALFVGFVFSRSSLSAMLADLPWITWEPTHDYDTLIHRLKGFFTALTTAYSGVTPSNWYFLALCFAWVLLVGILALDKNRYQHRIGGLCAAGVMALAGTILFREDISTQYHIILMPLTFLGLPAWLLCRKRDNGLFLTLYCVGFGYALCDYLASNNESYVIAMALTLANTASFVFVGQAVREELQEGTAHPMLRRLPAFLAAAACGVVLLTEGQVLRNLTFWDEPIYAIDSAYTDGPAAGIRTSQENTDKYEAAMADIAVLKQLPRGNIVFLSSDCWPYLAVPEHRCASFSSWVEGVHYEKLLAYYEQHPEKTPDYICIPEESWFNRQEYTVREGYTTYTGSRYIVLVKNDIAESCAGLLSAFAAGTTTTEVSQ